MKYLFVQEYLRVQHTIQHKDGTTTVNFKKSSTGKQHQKELRKHGIDVKDVDYAYVYNKVPEVLQTNRGGTPTKYADPTLKEVKPYYGQLTKKIVEEKPEVVIPNGKLGTKFFVDKTAITTVRGIPVQKTLEYDGQSHTFWVLPMFSMEYIAFRPSNKPSLEVDLAYLARYDKEGEEVFIPKRVDYITLTEYEEAIALFKQLREEQKVTAFDMESNTLQPERNGAKALTVSLTNEEGKGYTIPLEHKDHIWKKEELEGILQQLKELLADPDIPKVGHNVKFDVRFLISVYDFKHFEGIYDTMIGYWMTVTQDKSASFRLGDLAYEYTDIGGYDEELEEWKRDYIKEYRDPETDKKVKPTNEVDGSDFNYEWFPFDMLTYYAAGDVDATLRIHNALWENVVKDEKWIDLYTNFYPRMTRTIARMESNGLYVDQEYVDVLEEAYSAEYDSLIDKFRNIPAVQVLEERKQVLYEAGLKEFAKKPAERDPEVVKFRNRYKEPEKRQFNPNSFHDKGEVLYSIIGVELPIDKEFVKPAAMERRPRSNGDLTWEDYSTNAASLEEIQKGNYPEEAKSVAKMLEQFSKVSKLKSSFVDRAKTDTSDDGAVHGSFNITGTQTSRLSASNPK